MRVSVISFKNTYYMNKRGIKHMNKINDSELENVYGGVKKIQYIKVACIKCKESFDVDMSKDKARCPKCGKLNTFAG